MNESTEYDNMTATFPEDEQEKTDDSLHTERINKTIGGLPNNNAVTADNMQPILRTVSTITRSLLASWFANLLTLALAGARTSVARQSIRSYASWPCVP